MQGFINRIFLREYNGLDGSGWGTNGGIKRKLM